jgi:microcystin-dependent protein
MSEAFVGEVRLFGFSFAPKDWAQCNGQLVPIKQNPAMYSVLGTAFGGDGKTTFGLPNLQNNVPVGAGAAVTGTNYPVGSIGGALGVAITATTSPPHSHSLLGSGVRYTADTNVPDPTRVLAPGSGASPYVPPGNPPMVSMTQNALGQGVNPQTLQPIGTASASQHNNLMPYLAVNFCICMNGVMPQR